MTQQDEQFMLAAVAEAMAGAKAGEVPIGAVAVRDNVIVARGHNRRNELSDLTAHAEMICIRNLSQLDYIKTNGFDLSEITIYSTLEPCAMCLGAMIHYKVARVVFGEYDLLAGACGSRYDIGRLAKILVEAGVARMQCREPLLEYFERQLGHQSTQWGDIALPNE